MELLLEAADGVHLGHAPEVAYLRAHHPVLEFAQVRRSPFLTVGTFRPGLGLDRIHENLAETGRDRPHGRLDFGRQLRANLLDALVDELTREVDVRPVFEDHGHLRKSVTGERASAAEPGQTGHRRLHREGDPLLGLKRREAGRLGIDLHLDVSDVRDGVDGQRA